MTPFDTSLTALRAGPTDTLFKTVDKALRETVGHKLFTLLYVAPSGLRVKRIYTNMPTEYPVGGYKEVTATPWHKLVIQDRKPWVGYTAKDIEWAYFDHELIKSLGCELAMNIPVVYSGRVLGTMNLLDGANHYKATDPAKVEPFAALMIGPFLDAIANDPGMRRFILTGAPGSGKTAILRQLEMDGFAVVEEAATDVIALEQAGGISEPWTDPAFIDRVLDLQKARRLRASGPVQFHDRSAFCTAALAEFLGYAPSEGLSAELRVLKREAFYEKRVFFVRLRGFVEPTAARRIGLEAAKRFEAVHEKTYRAHGFELVPIGPGGVLDRAAEIRRAL